MVTNKQVLWRKVVFLKIFGHIVFIKIYLWVPKTHSIKIFALPPVVSGRFAYTLLWENYWPVRYKGSNIFIYIYLDTKNQTKNASHHGNDLRGSLVFLVLVPWRKRFRARDVRVRSVLGRALGINVSVCVCVGGSRRMAEAGLGRGRIWTVMMLRGLSQSQTEIWNWNSASQVSHSGAFAPSRHCLDAALYRGGVWPGEILVEGKAQRETQLRAMSTNSQKLGS